ncbi:probable isoprenylcysteine alpha-carbonyl methylesterase ICMEL1 [Humulus lupulus]|uniref:probable isoprenylcysteine alpha-carbonyl methylesterase ICMEL1 n=1 Tax=Humulus lupulus TaxID=3486 RepID=UPI002B40A0EF|nr:probable isoprenylcysteine alpha-carbonyl methylesterase ICMEL1 [Humulus lupulus]
MLCGRILQGCVITDRVNPQESEVCLVSQVRRQLPEAQEEFDHRSGFDSSYRSRQLKEYEKRYPTHDLELAAIAFAVKHRRRRTNSEDSISSLFDIEGRRSLRRDVGHATAETFLLTRLSLKLLRYLGVGYRWMTRFLSLDCYALLLVPGFCQVGYNYFFSSQIRRSIVYGDKPRNRLDLYLPRNSDGPKPVIAFVTGGAWIIGYKAWGSLLGQQLSERDIIVTCIDYRGQLSNSRSK